MKTDRDIQKDVMEELRWEPAVEDLGIGVSVHNGVVTLSGYVNFYAERLAAEKAAKRVKGVKAVAEDIEVRRNDSNTVTDAEVAESVVRALEWNTAIPEEKIKVKVDNGWVYLEGEVNSRYQKQAAADAISFLKGLRGVSNWITVKPKTDTTVIKENIRKALERSADLEADKIDIEVSGRKVILRGTARTWNERVEIERAVSNAPGVAEIDDHLVID